MRISDWSSDVCSSDLGEAIGPIGQEEGLALRHVEQARHAQRRVDGEPPRRLHRLARLELEHIGQEDHRLLQVGEEVAHSLARSEDPREGVECGRTCRFWVSRFYYKKKKRYNIQ